MRRRYDIIQFDLTVVTGFGSVRRFFNFVWNFESITLNGDLIRDQTL